MTNLPPPHPAFPDIRKAVRAELLSRRKALDPTEEQRLSAAVQRRVLALPEWGKAAVVALYMAARKEVSTNLLLEDAWKNGKDVLLPRCLPPCAGEGLMEFALCRDAGELKAGAFGLREPGPACPALPREGWTGREQAAVPPRGAVDDGRTLRLPDLILVPAVGISPAGARLGYGKGFYDRLLALPGWNAARRLALVYGFQIAAFPAGPLDIPMHSYATEKEVVWL